MNHVSRPIAVTPAAGVRERRRAPGAWRLGSPLAVFPALLVLASWLPSPADAIVMRHDRADAAYRELGARFPAVGPIGTMAEGTLIGDRWVLTAGHVAEHVEPGETTVRFGEADYAVLRVHLHPAYADDAVPLHRKPDLGLLELERAVKGVDPVAIYTGDDEAGKTVVFVGRGGFGDGTSGPVDEDRVVRGATNRIDDAGELHLRFTFGRPPMATDLEGISGPGDSGGPALLETDDGTFAVGVSSHGAEPDGVRPGTYGTIEFYTRVSRFADWIVSVID